MHRRFLVTAALSLSCGDGAVPVGLDASPDSFFVAPGADYTIPPPVCSETRPLMLERRDVNVLVVFDRSGSMSSEFGPPGTGSRFSVESSLLATVLDAYDERLRFGFEAFPARTSCDGHTVGCCVEAPSVDMKLGNAAAVVEAIAGAAPVGGNTPTAEALMRAREHFAALPALVGDKYVVLSTDGRPSCSSNGRLAVADVFDASGMRVAGACYDALLAVDNLVADGVQVIVLGVGSDLDGAPGSVASCLQDLGTHGAFRRSPDEPSFFPAGDPDQLEIALQQIFGGVTRPTCQLALEARSPDPGRVAVFFDGHEVPRNHDQGWDFESPDDGRHLRLFGEYCRRVERFQVKEIEIRFGCPPCREGAVCAD